MSPNENKDDVRRIGITRDTIANERALILRLSSPDLSENDMSSCIDLLTMLGARDSLDLLRDLLLKEGLSSDLKKEIIEAIHEIETGV